MRSGLPFAGAEEFFEGGRVVFEVLGEVSEAIEGFGTEVVLDAFDIGLLGFGVKAEE